MRAAILLLILSAIAYAQHAKAIVVITFAVLAILALVLDAAFQDAEELDDNKQDKQ